MNKSYLSLASLLAVAAMSTGFNTAGTSTGRLSASATQTNNNANADTKSTGTTAPATSRTAALLERLMRSSNGRTRYPNGPGWGIRQVQRMARKKRNVKANRKNQRG